MEAMHYQTLMERQRVERDSYHPTLGMRVHQALSWLSRAEQADDLDGRFIFLWIAFNAAYATEIEGSNHLPGQSIFVDFLSTSARINKCFNASRGLLDYPFSKTPVSAQTVCRRSRAVVSASRKRRVAFR